MAKTLKSNSNSIKKNQSTVNTGKKLTLKELQKIDASYDEVTIIPVNGYSIGINKKFKNTKIRDLVGDFVTIHAKLKELGVEEGEIDFSGIGFILIIKHFTDINVPDDLNGKLEYLEYLINADMLSPIMESFGEGELQKAIKMMNDYTDNVKELFKPEEEKE